MVEEESLVEAALRVLNTEDPVQKARLGDQVATQWLQGFIPQPYHPSDQDLPVPDRPARLTNVSHFIHIFLNPMAYQVFDKMIQRVCLCLFQVKLVVPGLMPKLGKAGSLQSRQAIVHSLVHIESWAIDLSWVLANNY